MTSLLLIPREDPYRKTPRTRTNDDHSMHIPGISSHRNVNNSMKRHPTGAHFR